MANPSDPTGRAMRVDDGPVQVDTPDQPLPAVEPDQRAAPAAAPGLAEARPQQTRPSRGRETR